MGDRPLYRHTVGRVSIAPSFTNIKNEYLRLYRPLAEEEEAVPVICVWYEEAGTGSQGPRAEMRL